MELDRPHRPPPSSSTTTTTDLLICFTSRLSHSSSMRLSSKSIHSPGRNDTTNKPPISLSTSLSRRLRTNNGSLRGGQSPMFPPGVSKKRGCAFENPEPSSPKVTCIGQVRVKTKKQGKKIKMAYKARRSDSGGGGDVSFRRIEGSCSAQDKNSQSWAHLPLTICDALSCFVPCKSSSCGGSGKGQERESSPSSSSTSSCGGGVLRWLVAFHEGEGGKTRDIELVVEEEEEEQRVVMGRECSRRRSIFDDMDFNVDEIGNGGEKEEGGRVSVCVPPKNALLLMRCRSDPVKVSALANKFWESPPVEEYGEEEEIEEERRCSVTEDEKIESFLSCAVEGGVQELPEEEEQVEKVGRCSIDSLVRVSDVSNLGMLFQEPDGMEEEEEIGGDDPPESIEDEEEEIQVTVIGKDSIFEEIEEFGDQDPTLEAVEEEENQDNPPEEEEEEEQSTVSEEEKPREEPPMLPDCLLLMMCEPKLSMEVSEETWVCSTDFIRWLPESHRKHQLKKIKGGDEPNNTNKKKGNKKNRGNAETNAPVAAAAGYLPPRSSCSFPISMASLIEKKLVSAVAYEPFVLTRCKSEPMIAATTAKFTAAQELACFWKNRKIEPAACGFGAAGVGF